VVFIPGFSVKRLLEHPVLGVDRRLGRPQTSQTTKRSLFYRHINKLVSRSVGRPR
jgi:hypothetical protein